MSDAEAEGTRKKPDQRVGPFVLLDELAGGGTARMFRARYRPLPADPPVALEEDDLVVIKVLRDVAVRDPKQVNAFTREAELLSMVDHPCVVRGLTRGVTAGRIWMAQEYVEGEDLSILLQAARTEQLRLRPEVALVIMLDLLAGLAAAQSIVDPRGRPLGLIHRDLSPKNVLLDLKGQTRLVDFGAALLSVREEPVEGEIIGTPGYLAPEQARGEQLTQGVDVYAAGLLLFEMFTGERAFNVSNLPDARILAAHAGNERAAWPTSMDIPLDVKQLVDQATGPTPEDRPADAAALYALVEGLLSDPDDARARLALVVRDLVLTNPDRPPPLLIQ
ncbi:MAG: serine/threonine-protein kinase [Deltaproteobacteria bacterium]|nr:serine/threonine-protein kinase [Deltaproteobacteria bacterium]